MFRLEDADKNVFAAPSAEASVSAGKTSNANWADCWVAELWRCK